LGHTAAVLIHLAALGAPYYGGVTGNVATVWCEHIMCSRKAVQRAESNLGIATYVLLLSSTDFHKLIYILYERPLVGCQCYILIEYSHLMEVA
jgi:hypothetical protein